MGDSRRFDLFARVVARNVGTSARVADVAGGKGHLQAALRQLGFSDVTSWDRRPRYAGNRRGYRYGYFDHSTAPEYDAVVAMHPDEGTDHALLYAAERRVPAVICPCCVRPSAAAYAGPGKYHAWVAHLVRLAERGGLAVTATTLPMSGRNDVLILKPRR